MRRSLVVAVADNGVIGRDGDLPWRLPDDLKRFRQLTLEHAIIMGRRTWESLPRGALKRRLNIVVTRQARYEAPGAEVVGSLDAAWEVAERGTLGGQAVLGAVVIGGAGLYQEALSRVDRMDITWVRASVEGDVHFPPVDWDRWVQVASVPHPADERHAHPFEFATYDRV